MSVTNTQGNQYLHATRYTPRTPVNKKGGIDYLSCIAPFVPFEELYVKVRSKEQRILDDDVVAQLPYVTKHMSAHYKEWKARAHSFERLRNYLQSMHRPLAVMDVGCGNGWAAAGLAQNALLTVSAVDINLVELKQGARVFHRPNLAFYFGNIFEDIFPAASFDVIILNACAQYFENLQGLIERLLLFLKRGGEVHIVDTPFYTRENIEGAKQRAIRYYGSVGFPEMARYYHHHDIDQLSPFHFSLLRRTGLLFRVYASITGDVPANFQWIRINNP